MDNPTTGQIVKWIILGLLALFLCIALMIGGCAGAKSYGRFQKRADAQNRVKVTHIEIQRAAQQAQINRAQIAATKAEAQKRIAEAHGIRAAQDIISKTLNPYYLQHEAIQAQKAIATSGQNNTVIYVPSGSNGTPLFNLQAQAGKGK